MSSQAAATEAEVSAGEDTLPGAVSVAFLFCDLKDFTAFAEAEGDGAAAAAVDRLAEVVADARGEQFRRMKALGDEVMLAYGDARPAVAAGTRIIERVRATTPLSVHASVRVGTAIARDGHYFGGAVNLTARLLGAAGRDELVATRPVVERTADSQTWESLGQREIRGVSEGFRGLPARVAGRLIEDAPLLDPGGRRPKGKLGHKRQKDGACPPSVVVAANSWRRSCWRSRRRSCWSWPSELR